jgi:endonuclease G
MKTISQTALYYIILITLLFSNALSAQDIVTLKHTFYTSHFSKSKHIPVLVEYELTSAMVLCSSHISRKGEEFRPDPLLADETNLTNDYRYSGYDRGHNMSAQDNQCNNTGMDECFYFSNIFPQVHSFNAGIWESLEKIEREMAKVNGRIKVFIGSLGAATTIGEDHVVVPLYCWKIIYIPSKSKYRCYVFPNSSLNDKEVEHYSINYELIAQKAGISFNGETAVLLNKDSKRYN